MRYVVLILLFALPATLAADTQAEAAAKERLQRVSAEVARRKAMRAAQENATRVVREHESGAKKATEEQLAAARAVLRDLAEQGSKGPKVSEVSLPGAEMQTVARAWSVIFNETVVVSDRAKSKLVDVRVSDPSPEEFRKKFVAALRANGIYVVKNGEVTLLDTQPEEQPEK
jgi:hypothetical protein